MVVMLLSAFRVQRLNPLPQLEHRKPQRIGDVFHHLEGGIRLSPFQPAQVGLEVPTPFPELNLAPTCLDAQLSNASAKALSKG